jgi:hypothetical protein
MKKLIASISTIVLCLVGQVAYAQSQYSDASIYSFLGAGMPVTNGSSQSFGMGLSGVSIRSQIHGNVSNPALWATTRLTKMNGGFSTEYVSATEQNSGAEYSNFKMNTFQVQLPIIRERLGVSMSLTPITEGKYSVRSVSSYIRPGNAIAQPDTINYSLFTRGEGGLNRLEIGFGYQIHERVSVGYAASVVFGNRSDYRETSFEDVGYAFTAERENVSSYGMGNRFGLYADTPKPFTNEDYLSLGVAVSLPVLLDETKKLTGDFGNTTVTLREDQKGERLLPVEYLLGLSYYPNQLSMISAEVHYQQWSKYQNFAGFNEDFLKDRVKLGIGFEYAAIKRQEVNAFTRFIYRAGISYDSGHLELNDTSIETIKFTAGLGIPSPVVGSSVDLNFDFGVRGTTSHELVRERIFAVRVTFNMSELMFLQRRLQ